MSSRAQLFTLDLLLALIPLTIMLGFSANAVGGVTTQIQEYVMGYSVQRTAIDLTDALAKTPGMPLSWNSTNSPSTPGLAYYDTVNNVTNPMLLDENKLVIVNATHISRLLNNQYAYFNLTVSGLEGNNWNVSTSNGTKANVTELVVVQRNLLVTLLRNLGEAHLTSHDDYTETEEACACDDPVKWHIWKLTFTATADEIANFKYWLGFASEGGSKGGYTLRSTPTTAYCPPTGHCDIQDGTRVNIFSESFGQNGREWGTSSISGNFTINQGINYVYIRTEWPPSGDLDFFIIKTPKSFPQGNVTESALADQPQAVRLTLEVGR